MLKIVKPISPTKKEDPRVFKAKRIPIINILKPQELIDKGSYLSVHCPFHDDQKSSLALYLKTNTWNCFAGCGGGDAISFYMRLYDVDFKTAVEEMTK